MQKMAAVETASAEERERLRATYKQRLSDMDNRLKVHGSQPFLMCSV